MSLHAPTETAPEVHTVLPVPEAPAAPEQQPEEALQGEQAPGKLRRGWQALWARLSAKPTHPVAFTLTSLLVAPLITLYASQVVWLQSLWKPLPWMLGHLGAVGLFWLLFSSASLALYGLIRRLFWAFIPEVGLFMGVAVSSRIKYDITGAPLQLSDFSMVGKLGEITGFATEQLIPTLLTISGIVVAAILTETLRRKETWHLSWKKGLIMALVSLAVLVSAFFPGPLQAAASYLERDCVDQMERNDESGVVLGLYAAWVHRQAAGRGEANEQLQALAQRVVEDAAQPTPCALEEVPDIIFITSESFFDITRLKELKFTQDPLPVFHRLAEEGTNGRFYSNTFGGGTGNVEMEMFTCLSSGLLKEGDTLCTLEDELYETLPTTIRALKKAGYSTTAIHSYNDELFERRDNFPAIGFDKVVFDRDFTTEPEMAGIYISDDSLVNEIIHHYEKRNTQKPCMIYGLSMENHQPYYDGKYEDSSGFPARCSQLNQEDLKIVDSLVHSLNHADAALGRLVEYFSQVDRPVLLVFVGDHLPSLKLTDEEYIYCRLGYTPPEPTTNWNEDSMRERLTTEYVIWSNYEAEPKADEDQSCTFLWLEVLRRAGVPLNDYFSWLLENVRPYMLKTQGRVFVPPDGSVTYHPDSSGALALESYTALQEALLYGK